MASVPDQAPRKSAGHSWPCRATPELPSKSKPTPKISWDDAVAALISNGPHLWSRSSPKTQRRNSSDGLMKGPWPGGDATHRATHGPKTEVVSSVSKYSVTSLILPSLILNTWQYVLL